MNGTTDCGIEKKTALSKKKKIQTKGEVPVSDSFKSGKTIKKKSAKMKKSMGSEKVNSTFKSGKTIKTKKTKA